MVENRCVFCLGEENGEWGEQQEEETRLGFTDARRLLRTFNTMCAYLQGTQRKQMGLEVNSGGVSLERFLEPGKEEGSSATGEFKELPKMCGVCKEKLVELEKRREEIRNLVLEFRRIIFESRNPGRCSKSEGENNTNKQGTKSVSSGKSGSNFQCKTEPNDSVTPTEQEDQEEAGSLTDSDESDSDSEMKCEPGDEDPLSEPFSEESVDKSAEQVDSADESECDNDTTDNCDKKFARACDSDREVALVKKPNSDEKRKSLSWRSKPRYHCTICRTKLAPQGFLEHVQGHVGSYAKKCPNYDVCLFAASNPIGVFRRHFHLYPDCDKVASQYRVQNRAELVCEMCGFRTIIMLAFRCHLKVVHERSLKKTEECPVEGCSARFCVRQSVELHLASHDKFIKTRQKCQVCLQIFNVDSIEDHLKSKHDVQEIIPCQHCSFRFSNHQGLLEHLYVHRFNGLNCDICGDNNKVFTRHGELLQHYSSAHQIKLFECLECKVSFSNKAHLTTHKRSKHATQTEKLVAPKKKLKTHACDLCLTSPPLTFKTQTHLVDHQIKVHGAMPFACSTCGETFTSAAKLRDHENEHKGIRKEFRCEVPECGQIFRSPQLLKRHISVVHKKERRVCEICGKLYTDANGLKHHYQAVHQKLKPFVCETCGECFSTGTTLKRHFLVHSGERPFACEVCGQKFRQKNSLKAHLDGHEKKGADFKPTGAWKRNRKRKHPVNE